MTKPLGTKENNSEELSVYFPPYPESSRLKIRIRRSDYQGSRVAHAVEDADAGLLNLNLTALDPDSDWVTVALRVGHRDPNRVARSLERYGFQVIGIDTDPADDDDIRQRYDELMHWLNV